MALAVTMRVVSRLNSAICGWTSKRSPDSQTEYSTLGVVLSLGVWRDGRARVRFCSSRYTFLRFALLYCWVGFPSCHRQIDRTARFRTRYQSTKKTSGALRYGNGGRVGATGRIQAQTCAHSLWFDWTLHLRDGLRYSHGSNHSQISKVRGNRSFIGL